MSTNISKPATFISTLTVAFSIIPTKMSGTSMSTGNSNINKYCDKFPQKATNKDYDNSTTTDEPTTTTNSSVITTHVSNE
jgi:hypothetical protein